MRNPQIKVKGVLPKEGGVLTAVARKVNDW